MRRAVCFFFMVALAGLGCGRYIAPSSPDLLIAEPVEELQATLTPEKSLVIQWMVPQRNLSGKKLKNLEGYQIEKAEGGGTKTLSDLPLERQFEKVAFIPDTYFEALRKKQDETEERGDIVRKVSLDAPLKTFSFTEKTLPQGVTLYRVFAVNEEGGEGDISKAVQLTNQGDMPTVTVLKQLREKQ